jgi:polysaccharide biosynthesis transport protein
VLLRERVDRKISAPGDTQVHLNLPELGVIPTAEISASRQIFKTFFSRSPNTLSLSTSGCPELATWQDKASLMAECVRATLTSILWPGQNGRRPHILLCTSPCPGDGKTTVTSNLGIAIAEIGQTVVLIDSDLRCPRLHTVFGASNSWGLTDVLGTDTPLESLAIEQLVCKTKISRLAVLPGGSGINVSPSSLFYSPRMSRLLARLRSEFDMVIIDAPPMIHLADARVLGRLADGVILVVRAGQTSTESALFAVRRFAEDGTPVLGTVLNNFDPSTSGHYAYSGYKQYYGSYASSGNKPRPLGQQSP